MSSQSFWRAESNVPILQTSQSVPVLNGLNFKGGQELRIKVPPTTRFIQPKECYLKADFLITLPAGKAPTYLQLDERMGGQALIRDIRIFSSAEFGSVLLEELQGYNRMVSVMRDYDTSDSDKAKRAMTEGTTTYAPDNKGTRGTSKSEAAGTLHNPYFEDIAQDQAAVFTTFESVKLALPLETGIFRSERVWANMLTGLEIVITLEDPSQVLRQLDNVMADRRPTLNPMFYGANASSVVPANIASAVDFTKLFFACADNTNLSAAHFPFCVGEKVGFCNAAGDLFAMTGSQIIKNIKRVESEATAGDLGIGLIEVEFVAATATTNAAGVIGYAEADPTLRTHLCSLSVSTETDYPAQYELSNVELVVQELNMGSGYENDLLSSMKEKGGIVNDILSVRNYRYSQNKGDIVANIRLPLVESRARSIICVPTDASNYNSAQRISADGTYSISSVVGEDCRMNSTNQFRGVSNRISNFQWLYGGRLQPSRAVKCSKISSQTSIDAQPLIETTKALVQANISAKSLAAFNSNFVVCRALALNKGVYDARGQDFNLQVNYQETTSPPVNMLWDNFVFALHRIIISGDSIRVEV